MAKPTIDAFTGPDAVKNAERMARHGHADWLYWKTRAGELVAKRMTSAAIKEALLAVGTQGHFIHIGASHNWRFYMRWSNGIHMMHQVRYYETHGNPMY